MYESRYNMFVKEDNGQVIGYNTLTKAMVRIHKENWPKIQSILSNVNEIPNDAETKQFYENLTTQNFLIPDTLDELRILKFRYQQSVFNSSHVLVNLVPIMSCNFDCKYCFEHKTNRRMTEETLKAIEIWLINQLKSRTLVHIGWFGGEPLLCKDMILYLNQSIKKTADENKRNFYSSITTNGYLLTSDFADKILELGFVSAQVTIDGDEEGHNYYRPLANGKGSFKKLVSNIEYLAGVLDKKKSDFNLSLRVNVGEKNYHGIENLLNLLSDQVRRNSNIYFRWIWSNKEKKNISFVGDLNPSEKYRMLDDLYHKALDKGFKTSNPFTETRNYYCEVDNVHHYYVSPEGGFYVCSESYKTEEAIGFIKSDGTLEIKADEMVKWFSKTPFEDKVCVECKLLPMCFGGCRKTRTNDEGRSCISEKQSLDRMIKTIYAEKMRVNIHKPCSKNKGGENGYHQ